MDNISRRLSNEDTATSMYLSFDAESTMSTACYKTMEAMSDISTMSSLSIVEGMENMNNNSDDKHMNSTLEAQDDSPAISPLKTIKKLEQVTSNTPLRVLPKNILKEYKALCSTPSKEQLLKTVDVTRGSDATRCVDLGLAFLGVDDEKPAYFPPPPAEQFEENKENAIPESGEGSTLSVSSSVEITTSVIERKMISSMSTVGSITEEESVEEIKVVEKVEDRFVLKGGIETTPKANNENILKDATKMNENVTGPMDRNETTCKVNREHPSEIETITECSEKSDESTPKVKEIILTKSKLTGKPKIAILSSRNTRRSVCEPNLQTNKPSRILNSGRKRQSLLPTSGVTSTQMDVETEIPILMSKMLKISNDTSPMQVDEVIKKDEPIKELKKLVAPNEKRRSIMASMKTRTSLIPLAPGEKRPFGFTQRMSVVVKTTLNSPARKIARKSTMGTTMSYIQRRSMMPTKSNSDESSKIPNNHLAARRSVLPKSGIPMNNKTATKNLPSVKESTVSTTTQIKSLYPTSKANEGSKIKPPSGTSYHKLENSFTCNVCKEKFKIKSLLDAHKRSHESDNATPAFIKKPVAALSSSSASSSLSNSNQCKYCDKKFALVRALNIHLLQNCSKIPPADKRKLQYTDLNHVEKAQLPNVFHSTVPSTSATSISALKQPRNTAPKSSSESLHDNNNDVQKSTMDAVTVEVSNQMVPPHTSVQKIKKNTAHAGVYRTPSKTVPCHLCKLTFKSILDYTNHNLTAHGSGKTHHNSDKGNQIAEN